jgi:hypothetical protein
MASFFAAMPATTNYQLHDYGFGNGSGTTSTGNYSLEGVAGEQSSGDSSTSNATAKSGLQNTQQANVPAAPTFTNPSNWYDKLHVGLNPGSDPSDTLYAIAISSDNFVTTRYIQNDTTVGPALGIEDYQTYATWGGVSGFTVIGLTPNTSYSIKAKAMQGTFTESGYGPSSTVSTSDLSLTFDIDVSATNSETSSPYLLDFGTLLSNNVNDSPKKVWFDLDTNADFGGSIFVVSQNAGLKSTTTGYTISAVSGNLGSLNEGFGAQATQATAGSGTFSIVSPFDGTSNTVGAITTQYQSMFTASTPLAAGRSAFLLKAKSTDTTPAAADYADTFTAVAAVAF